MENPLVSAAEVCYTCTEPAGSKVENGKLKVENYGEHNRTKEFPVCDSDRQSVQACAKHKKRIHAFRAAAALRNQYWGEYYRGAAGAKQSGFCFKAQHCTERSIRNKILDQIIACNGVFVGAGVPVYLRRLYRN